MPSVPTVVPMTIGRPVATTSQVQDPESHALTVPPTPGNGSPKNRNSTARKLFSSISVTYSVPSGPNERSTIDVNPSATTVHAGLVPHVACNVPGAIRQIRDSPVGPGKPLSSPP